MNPPDEKKSWLTTERKVLKVVRSCRTAVNSWTASYNLAQLFVATAHIVLDVQLLFLSKFCPTSVCVHPG